MASESILFRHYADDEAYSAVTPPKIEFTRIAEVLHNIPDTTLLIPWAMELHKIGDDRRARYLIGRMREFGGPEVEQLMEVCAQPRAQGSDKPFQCYPLSDGLSYRDFP